MSKLALRPLCVSAMAALALSAGWLNAEAAKPADSRQHLSLTSPRQWHKAGGRTIKERSPRSKVVTNSDWQIGPVNSMGTLEGPDGMEWVYTSDYDISEDGGYKTAHLKIYNSQGKLMGNIDTDFPLQGKEVFVNYVEIDPLITQKFFNIDDKFEVILFVHAVTSDFAGSFYQMVFSIAPDQTEPLMRIEGNSILRKNFAADQWSEKFYFVTMNGGEGENIDFNVYAHADWSSQRAPRLVHTFAVPGSLINDLGENAYPITLQNIGGKPYFALSRYQKPYFVDDETNWLDPVANTDNQLIIDVYDGTALESDPKPEYTVTIPVEQTEGFLFTFPCVGAFSGNNDFAVDLFGSEPHFIVTCEKYLTSLDDFVDDFHVYNLKGEKVATIATDVEGYLKLMPIAGQPDQYCFYNANTNSGYKFVELPSCKQVAHIPFELEGKVLSTSLDRVPIGNSYQYALALVNGLEMPNGDISHDVAYFNPGGEFSHWEHLNLGSEVVMAQVAIAGEWLDPYLFDTNPARDYMFIVKLPSADNEYVKEEHLWIISSDGKKLLDFGPSDKLGGDLVTVAPLNIGTQWPTLLTLYSSRDYDAHLDHYTLNFNSLPLLSFEAGGDGSAENPYMITTPGDFMQIAAHPDACFSLAADVDFNHAQWTGVQADFTGTLDGNGHVVSNMALTGSGMFATLQGPAKVSNLVIASPEFTPTDTQTGLVAGMTMYDGTNAPSISDVYVIGAEVSAPEFDGVFGGIVGRHTTGAVVSNVSVEDASISLPNATVGGVVGTIAASGATVQQALFTGQIEGHVAGGIVGSAAAGNVADCHVNGQIDANVAGGVAGELEEYALVRPTVARCFVEGEVKSSSLNEPHVGGIAGTMGEGDNLAVTNNVVAAKLAVPADATDATIHRIVGYSCGDMPGAIDWENQWWSTPGDKSDSSQWPRLPVEPEKGLADNYALAWVTPANPDMADDAASVEGKSVDKLTKELLVELGFDPNVWVIDANPMLHFEAEARALYAACEWLTAEVGEQIEVVFTLVGGSASGVAVETSDAAIAEVIGVETDRGRVVATVKVNSAGVAQITATYGSLTSTVNLDSRSGVADNLADVSPAITYANGMLRSSGRITVFSTTGALVASGSEALNVMHLPRGIYVAVAQGGALKFVR